MATATPTNPGWVTNALQDYAGAVGDWGQTDPNGLVAGPSALQTQAFTQAGNLGGWQSGLTLASGMAQTAGNAPANLAQATDVGNPRFTRNTVLGAAGQAALADYAPIREAEAQGYTADQAQASRANEFIADYMNPYLSEVVDTTLADFDQDAGKTRAAQAAQAAASGAFGGSRYGIQVAATEGELARARAASAAGLRANAYNFAGQMGAADADRITNTSVFNTGQTNDARAFGANANNQASMFNAGAENARSANLFNAGNELNRFNTGARNDFALTQGQMDQQTSQFNSGLQRDYSFDQAGRNDAASQFNASQEDQALARRLQAAGLTGELANMGANNQRADLGLTADLGAEQRTIAQQQAQARLAQLQAQGQLLGAIPFNLFQGQNINTTGSSSGSSTQASTPGLGSILGAGLAGWASSGFA